MALEGALFTLSGLPNRENVFLHSGVQGYIPQGVGDLCNGVAVKGVWILVQSKLQFKYMDLVSTSLALKHFGRALRGQHVLVKTNSTTVVSYINRQGMTSLLPRYT